MKTIYKYILIICANIFTISWANSEVSEYRNVITDSAPYFYDSDIATVIQSDPELSMFSYALKSSAIWQRIHALKNGTVFVVPDNSLQQEGSAFLLQEVLVTRDNFERLNNLVGQHVFPDISIELRNLNKSEIIKDLHQGCILLHPLDNATKVGREAVVIKSIETNNGYIHYIDRLLWTPYDASEKLRC